jgi:hypothetical protein
MTLPTPEAESWEERFDKQFSNLYLINEEREEYDELVNIAVKKFISEERKRAQREILEELFNLKELTKDWEKHFYESDWTVDTLTNTKSEESILEELGTFMPRHMPVYDWNLPYNEAILLVIRRHVALSLGLTIKE